MATAGVGQAAQLLISPAAGLAPFVRSRIDDEAERVAAARGLRLQNVVLA